MRYLRKGKEVEAICWDSEENIKAIKKMLGDNLVVEQREDCSDIEYWLKYKYGNQRISWGDYVVKDPDGFLFVFDPSYFNWIYTSVNPAKELNTVTAKDIIWNTGISVSNGKEYFTWHNAIDIAESLHNKLPSVEDIKEAISIAIEILPDDKKVLLCREIQIPFNGYGWHIGGTYSLICDGTHGFIWTSDIQDEDNAIAFFCSSNSWGFCAIPKKTKCNIILCENGTSGN